MNMDSMKGEDINIPSKMTMWSGGVAHVFAPSTSTGTSTLPPMHSNYVMTQGTGCHGNTLLDSRNNLKMLLRTYGINAQQPSDIKCSENYECLQNSNQIPQKEGNVIDNLSYSLPAASPETKEDIYNTLDEETDECDSEGTDDSDSQLPSFLTSPSPNANGGNCWVEINPNKDYRYICLICSCISSPRKQKVRGTKSISNIFLCDFCGKNSPHTILIHF